MIDFLTTRPLPLALIGAHCIPFAIVAFAVIAVRLFGRKFRRGESMLLLAFAAFVAFEILQLSADGRSFLNRDYWGVDRYFGVFAPFLWIFAAKGFSYVLWHPDQSVLRPIGRGVLGLGLAWMFFGGIVGSIWQIAASGTSYDTKVAVEQIVPVIQEDYMGLARQPVIRRSLNEYYTGKRPLVSSPYAAAGWAVRGDSCGATGVKCPYLEDYLFFPLGSGYAGITNIDVSVYKFITSVPGGLGTKWMLFRRRTTPGRKR